MPLWGFKQGTRQPAIVSNDVANNDDEPRDGHPPDPPATEYTRLLPHRIDTDTHQYLTPDDPAVSPYNLWTVRALRILTIFLVAVALAWWIILLVVPFATPPGLHAPGSGFFSFAYATIALAEVLLALVFFGSPARAVRIVGWIIALFLLADMITVAAVGKLRYEEGWAGIVTVVWALLMVLWAIVTDSTVQWGKTEEEERLTGYSDHRRTAGEWVSVMISTVGQVLVAAAVILMTSNLVLRSLDASVEAPGERYLVDGAKYRIHLHCRGNKTHGDGYSPAVTVLLEGGDMPVEHGLWQVVDDALDRGDIDRYCFADRPGMAWSDTAPSPFSAGFAADALGEALAKAGETGPWVLASTGVGSLYSRVFSTRHGRDIAGLMLMDPLHEDLLYRIGNPSVGFRRWVRGVLSPLGLDRISAVLFRSQGSLERIYGPAARWGGKYIFGKLQESLVAETLTRREVDSSRAMQGKHVPLVVVSSRAKMQEDSEWRRSQEDMTTVTDKLLAWDVVDVGKSEDAWEGPGRHVVMRRLGQLVRASAARAQL